jgi:hypothetical protein
MNSRVLKRLKTVKYNPAEPMVVKNWETVDVARLVRIENAFQDSIVVDGWGWEETDLEIVEMIWTSANERFLTCKISRSF